ncbi:MAG: response regulator transcription factor [Deltaproteobacteria bacterium]|nr:response regulator transcription factor [Deltaproteobacteria bacterium]
MMRDRPITVLLTHRHRLTREGIASLLANHPDMTVVGLAEDGAATERLAHDLDPDVVLIDLILPRANAVDTARRVLADLPRTRVVALSAQAETPLLAEMLRAGASGFVVQESSGEELASAIRTVADGGRFVSPAVANTVLSSCPETQEPSPRTSAFSVLSAREREVLQLLAEGMSAKEIAGALHVSVKTVETHRANIMDKLDIHSIAGLTRYAVREGLASLGS